MFTIFPYIHLPVSFRLWWPVQLWVFTFFFWGGGADSGFLKQNLTESKIKVAQSLRMSEKNRMMKLHTIWLQRKINKAQKVFANNAWPRSVYRSVHLIGAVSPYLLPAYPFQYIDNNNIKELNSSYSYVAIIFGFLLLSVQINDMRCPLASFFIFNIDCCSALECTVSPITENLIDFSSLAGLDFIGLCKADQTGVLPRQLSMCKIQL